MDQYRLFSELNEYLFGALGLDASKIGESEKKYARIRMKEIVLTEEQRVAPDTYACECMFLRKFITPEMSVDFNLIAKDFLQHEIMNLSEYNTLHFISSDPEDNYPQRAFDNQILNLMMNAVRTGNEYARQLFCYLHKTYYKREYRILKRFRKISGKEVLDIANDGGKFSDYSVARILCISRMYGIEVDEDCVFFYLIMDEIWEKISGKEKNIYNFREGILQEAEDALMEMFDSFYDMNEAEDAADAFTRRTLKYYGYREDLVLICDEDNGGVEDTLLKTLAMAKSCFPEKNFTRDEILAYGQVWNAISALHSLCEYVSFTVKETLGIIEGEYDDENEAPLFKPDEISGQPVQLEKKKQNESNEKRNVVSQNDSAIFNEIQLIKKIEELRINLHLQENLNRELRKQLQESNRKLQEQEERIKSLQEDRKELIVLREHVYHLTEGMEPVQEISMEEMVPYIMDKAVMIIGGNENWVNKLKQLFPGWRFISPKTSAAITSMQSAKIDKAYFFTDTLAHGQYYKYIQVVRSRNLPFGYIHGVNITANVRQIYLDFKNM